MFPFLTSHLQIRKASMCVALSAWCAVSLWEKYISHDITTWWTSSCNLCNSHMHPVQCIPLSSVTSPPPTSERRNWRMRNRSSVGNVMFLSEMCLWGQLRVLRKTSNRVFVFLWRVGLLDPACGSFQLKSIAWIGSNICINCWWCTSRCGKRFFMTTIRITAKARECCSLDRYWILSAVKKYLTCVMEEQTVTDKIAFALVALLTWVIAIGENSQLFQRIPPMHMQRQLRIRAIIFKS